MRLRQWPLESFRVYVVRVRWRCGVYRLSFILLLMLRPFFDLFSLEKMKNLVHNLNVLFAISFCACVLHCFTYFVSVNALDPRA